MSIKNKTVYIDGEGHANFSTTPSDGTHIFKLEDGTCIIESKFNSSLMMRFTVDDASDPDNGYGFTWFLPVTGEGERGQAAVINAEKYLCTVICALGIADTVDNAIGNVDSYMSLEIIGKLAEILNAVGTDKYVKLKIRTTPKGKTYISDVWPLGTAAAPTATAPKQKFAGAGVSFGS